MQMRPTATASLRPLERKGGGVVNSPPLKGKDMSSENTNRSGPRPVFDRDLCKGCGRCVAACPRKCLEMETSFNRAGVKPAGYKGEGCVGCGMCFYNCPEPYAIRVEKD